MSSCAGTRGETKKPPDWRGLCSRGPLTCRLRRTGCRLLLLAVAVMRLTELLDLVGREDAGELLLGLLANGSHLLPHGCGGKCRVIFQDRDFAIAIGKDGFELRGLIGG